MTTKVEYMSISIDGCDRDLLETADPALQLAFTKFVRAVGEAGKCHAKEWRLFYRMVATACDVDYVKRWRVSQFHQLLRSAGFPRSGDFATAYAHGFYSIMTHAGSDIYEGGVFV